MNKNRYINTHFWLDEFVAELEPKAKLLFIYLLTNAQTNLAGAYRITPRQIAFDTGLEPGEIAQFLGEFELADKIIFRDGWLVLTNFLKHQSTNNPKIRSAILQNLKHCPKWVYDRLSIGYQWLTDSPSYLNSNFNSNSKTLPGNTKRANKREGYAHARETATETFAPDDETENPEIIPTEPIAARIPKNFELDAELKAWAREFLPVEIDVAEMTENFKNYYAGLKGEKAYSPNWSAVWKTWAMREKKILNEKNEVKNEKSKRKTNGSNGNGKPRGEHDFSKFNSIEFEN